MTVRTQAAEESGFTFVELAVAMVIMMVVVAAVAATVTAIAEQTTKLSSSTESIDALQIAEETLVQDIHAANMWYSGSGCTGTAGYSEASQAGPVYTYYFTANLFDKTPCITVTLSQTTHTLTIVSTAGGSQSNDVVVSNLDTTSAITPGPSPATQVGNPQTSFNDWMSVVLTQDSPAVGAVHAVKTTMSDTRVIAFPIEYQCEADSAIVPPAQGGSSC